MSTLEKVPASHDEVERKAEIDERLKEEAWRELRVSLGNLKRKPAGNPPTEERPE